nr:MAG TPA: hypothetical protein [Caudoviricetes sp.]
MRINIFYPHSGTPFIQPPCALVLLLCMVAFRALRCGNSAVGLIKSRIL